ncbi:hypothetical protein [Fodinicola acaciae]|uniref:hypothetical protein n=1 Tax=Fodinicola acaciae TaxID=2681555 RepID=UPI0013D3F2C7|nr:hypothetical protein [Fodinicola acaciae]
MESIGRGSRFVDVANLFMHCCFWDSEPGAARLLLDYARSAEAGEFEVSLAMCMIDNLSFQIENDPAAADGLLRIAATIPDRL